MSCILKSCLWRLDSSCKNALEETGKDFLRLQGAGNRDDGQRTGTGTGGGLDRTPRARPTYASYSVFFLVGQEEGLSDP